MPSVDPERLGAFARFLWRRFLDDRCLETASALSYTSVVALVPLTATLLGVAAMFPLYAHGGDALTAFLFRHFVPGAAASIADDVRTFAHSARSLTGWGAAGLLVTALLTMASIEDVFNRIWRVATPRRAWARFLVYCAALVFGPLLGLVILAISSYVVSLPLVATAEQAAGVHSGLHLLPGMLEWIAFAAAYVVVPNRSVRLLHALAGGLLAAALFEASKFVIAVYLAHASYRQIYGAVAVAPIFVLWIWVAWLVVLLGASFTAALPAFRHRPLPQKHSPGFEFYALLRLLGRLAHADARARGLHSERLLTLEPMLDDDLLQHLLGLLAVPRVIERGGHGQWRVLRDLDTLELGQLHALVGLPLPLGDAVLPCNGDALGRRVGAALASLREPLRGPLRRSIGSIFQNDRQTNPGPSNA